MTRFTQTDKWKDLWFRTLKPTEKLVFIFVIENCNNAGFYEVDMGMMAFSTGLDTSEIEGAFKALQRGLIGASGWVWVRSFLKHQKNEEINPSNPAHKQVISLIKDQIERFGRVEEFRAFIGAYKGLFSPICISKGQVKEEGGVGETRQSKSKCTAEESSDYCVSLGLQKSDGVWFFDKCESSGWKNAGKPIADWKATIRAWSIQGYMPSQKNAPKQMPTTTAAKRPDRFEDPMQKELDNFFANGGQP